MIVFTGLLDVHYGQAHVFSGQDGDTGDLDACFRGQSNGLLGAAQCGMLFLITGLHTGFVDFCVEVADEELAIPESWEECVEASFSPDGRDVRLVNWNRDVVSELPLESRDYRVRYAARGMDLGHERDTVLEGEEPVDSYRLWVWPASRDRDRIIKQTSEPARYQHDWARAL